MKENGSMAGKVLDGNWVMKRKRRKLPCGIDTSNGKDSNSKPWESPSSTSSMSRLKTEKSSDHSSIKRKGNDGYYYECVICDLGGNLLCCDSCPRTYHLQCLDPPLKRIPTGKWECPNCCTKGDPPEPMTPLDPISKRARTKIIIGKSKTLSNSSDNNKVSPIFGSSIVSKKRSSSKEKASSSPQGQIENKLDSSNDISCSAKPSHPSWDEFFGVSSSNVRVDDEKKPEVSLADTEGEKKPISDSKEVKSSSGITSPKTNKGTFKRKRALSSKKRPRGIRPILALEAANKKARKRSHKLHIIVSKKKRRTGEDKCAPDTSNKRSSKATTACPATRKLLVKRKIVEPEISATQSHGGVGTNSVNVQLKDEMLPEKTARPSNESHRAGKLALEPLIKEYNVSQTQQVDRVLGCRAKVLSSDNTRFMGTTDLSPETQMPEDQNKQFEENPADMPSNGMIEEDFAKGYQDIEIHPDGRKNGECDCRNDKLLVYRRSVTKECRDGNGMESMRGDIESSDSKAMNKNTLDDPSGNTGDLLSTVKSSEENNNFCLEGDGNSGILKNSGMPLCNEVGGLKENNKDFTANCKSKKLRKESSLAEYASSSEVADLYEFLVKWVGKSHIHNTWVPESELKVLAKRKLDNYKAKYGIASLNLCEERWKQPQRVIAIESSTDGSALAFVKWTALPYDECTWEIIDEPVIAKSSHLIDLYNQFENQTLEKDATKSDVQRRNSDFQQSELITLTEQPKELQGGALFPHQLEALNWLRKCWYKSKNVILADEMGLGKTVSACAFISSLYFEFRAALPCLVLVPLSTMPNWMSEFALWAPNLNVVEYHGSAKGRTIIRQYEWHASDPSQRTRKTVSYKFNVLLTTYEMVLADSSYLRGVPWEVLVVDEGHRLKNSSSKLFSLLNSFSFQHRVLLTGTPLQNNIGEMFNLLNFLQPASFPSLSSFEEKFNDLTTAEKVDELKKLVAPHMLRRLKKDAMQNIPPKTERMVPVELSSIQAEYYRAMLTKNYQILRNIGKGVAQQSMLNIVMQLRKVCNHPYLIPGTEPESGSLEFLHEMQIKASAKLTLLHSMLKVLQKEGHRVLIFSQMTKLLDILEDYLNIEFGPKTFERVDGSVSVVDRQAAIARFNQDKSRFVFLLSTRSCGLGINLATADTVIIYDSDFNPHADIQAMNRAHRIGQSNRLLVYRLVVRASVEERILQLAKKKLMLDQLFVNKSGSQKEVEDILRWGTEELFGDSSSVNGKEGGENNCNKDEALPEIDQKHKKRTGSLGDVYKDRCTDNSNKIMWDENAILKLLDRSNLQSGSPDNAEAESENDMLGSVKSMEWNDEPTEEQTGTASLPVVTDDTCTQNSEKKEDNVVGNAEENEWDRLLRLRWEKYQSEEEAALGRGKRQRKAVSYREAYALHPSETFSETGADEEPEPEPEPEPEREYTSAGRAWKTKYGKLRARQKERLAKRNANETCCLIEGPSGPEAVPQLAPSHVRDGNQKTMLVQLAEEKALSTDLVDNRSGQTIEQAMSKTDATLNLGKISRQKLDVHLDIPVKRSAQHFLALAPLDHHLQRTSFMNSIPSNVLSPILGLCAPNANQLETSQRNFSKSNHRQNRNNSALHFPFPPVSYCGTSNEISVKGHSNLPGRYRLPDLSSNASHHVPNNIPDNFLPSHPSPLSDLKGKGRVEHLEISGGSFSEFREKLILPRLPMDDNLLQRFPFPAKNLPHAPHELFPSLSLRSKVMDANNSSHDLPPTMLLLPNLKFLPQDAPKYNQQDQERPPSLGLSQMTPSFSSFPENHRKVLENIMLRTGPGSSNLLKKKSKLDIWSEDELDYLWIGVRRHGRGNWDAMLQDPRLKFSKFKTAENISARWEEEQLKILDGPAFPLPKPVKSSKCAKSSLFPGISDGMMTRALHGSKFNGPLKFQSHLTDMKLGFGDLPSSLPHVETSNNLGLRNDLIPALPPWAADKSRTNFSRDFAAGPSDRLVSSSVSADSPLLLNSFGTSSLDALGMNNSTSFDLSGKEIGPNFNRFGKLPSFLDRPLNALTDSQSNIRKGESGCSALLSDLNKVQNISYSKGKEVVGCSSPKDNLPHWLREAVNAPAKPIATDLPPTVSAIARSVRLLYGEENSRIPPFVVLGPPPSQPKDPRKSLKKKKRKSHKLRQLTQDFTGTSSELQSRFHDENVASSSVLRHLPFSMLPNSETSTSGLPWIRANTNILPLRQNVMNSPSLLVDCDIQKKTTGLSPPEMLQLVASCVVPGPLGSANSRFTQSQLQSPKSLDHGKYLDLDNVHIEQEERQSLNLGPLGPLHKEKQVESGSGDSSKTQSDPAPAEQPHVDEISSEGTVSDHHVNDHEP